MKKLFLKIRRIIKLYKELDMLQFQVDILKSKIDTDNELLDLFVCDRNTHVYNSVYEKHKPLVTICIGTYNRGRLLLERSVASALAQSYENIEVIVVGDCCTDDTEKLISTIRDNRLKFINLPKRGNYPEEPIHRWRVAGTVPFNYALSIAKGDFITHLDDDDEFVPDRTEKLVGFIQESKADLVWHPFMYECADERWRLNEAAEFAVNKVTTSSIFYHRWFAQIPWDINAYRLHEPGDWNRLRKVKYLGARVARFPEPLLKHYRERSQRSK
ncbi:glycosyltransferase family 2 protein [Geobacter sp.]|uniref:glycosyltransferase family 2 protein n=1 Tax=Geobacter sp. TaxID=46610 RepID=UPI00261662C0|nr:glycosyltransferase family 2 protein [Geobacter sp.]